jgi:DNA-binding transcriptional ArsR family regulator
VFSGRSELRQKRPSRWVRLRDEILERIVRSDEITVVALMRGRGVTQGAISQNRKAFKRAGQVAERPEGRNVHYRVEPQGLAPLVWRLLARALC